ncbi:hypothetical protein CAPTEDRAFT_216180, partial [Capitella teleta]
RKTFIGDPRHEDAFFCDLEGCHLQSPEISRITRQAIGGSVSDMRKAQYLAAKKQNPSMCHSDFNSMASHMSHSTNTAKKYYEVEMNLNSDVVEEMETCTPATPRASTSPAAAPMSVPQRPTTLSCRLIRPPWIHEDELNLRNQFARELSLKKMNINEVRSSQYFDYYTRERNIHEKQLMNKLQYVKKKT